MPNKSYLETKLISEYDNLLVLAPLIITLVPEMSNMTIENNIDLFIIYNLEH